MSEYVLRQGSLKLKKRMKIEVFGWQHDNLKTIYRSKIRKFILPSCEDHPDSFTVIFIYRVNQLTNFF